MERHVHLPRILIVAAFAVLASGLIAAALSRAGSNSEPARPFSGDTALASQADVGAGPHMLAGRVIDSATIAPLHAADVFFVDTAGKPVYQMTTDSTGDFDARLPTGRYRMHVEKPGYTEFTSRWFDISTDLPIHVIALARSGLEPTMRDAGAHD